MFGPGGGQVGCRWTDQLMETGVEDGDCWATKTIDKMTLMNGLQKFGRWAAGLRPSLALSWLVWIGLSFFGQSFAQEEGVSLARRRTSVVTVFEGAKDAVVNISSTRIVEVRSPWGMDRFLEDLFDFPRLTRQLKRTSVGSGIRLAPGRVHCYERSRGGSFGSAKGDFCRSARV